MTVLLLVTPGACHGAVGARALRRHKLDLSIEEKIFVSNDLEDLRAETLRTEQALRSEIEVRGGMQSTPFFLDVGIHRQY